MRGLCELLRVAEEDEVLGSATDGEHIRERELARFVDDEYVDGVAYPRARPEPCGPDDEVDRTAVNGGVHLLIVVRMLYLRGSAVLVITGLLEGAQLDSSLRRNVAHLTQQSALAHHLPIKPGDTRRHGI